MRGRVSSRILQRNPKHTRPLLADFMDQIMPPTTSTRRQLARLRVEPRFPLFCDGLHTHTHFANVASQACGLEPRVSTRITLLLGARTLLGAPGRTTRNKKLLGAPGIATRSKDATHKSMLSLPQQEEDLDVLSETETAPALVPTGLPPWNVPMTQLVSATSVKNSSWSGITHCTSVCENSGRVVDSPSVVARFKFRGPFSVIQSAAANVKFT